MSTEKRWTKIAKDILLNRKIVIVKYMSEKIFFVKGAGGLIYNSSKC